MEHIEAAIQNYLNSNDEFALLIDGDWGTGKTYFIQNTLLSDIDSLKSEKVIKKIYVSLYGQTSVESIKKVIIAQIFNHVSKFYSKSAEGAKNVFSYINLPFVDTEKLTGDLIKYLDKDSVSKIKKGLQNNEDIFTVIIDDLERIHDISSINDLFGFIRNELLDILNLKVIIIGNMKEVENHFNNQYSNLDKYKEKVIGRTLKFENNTQIAFELLEKNLKGYFDDEVLKDKKFRKELTSLFGDPKLSLSNNEVLSDKDKGDKIEYKNNYLNLRTLQLVLSDFKIFYNNINHKDNKCEYQKSLLYSLFIVNNEYRNGNYNEDRLPYLANGISLYDSNTKLVYKRYMNNYQVSKLVYIDQEIVKYVLHNDCDFEKYLDNLSTYLDNHLNPKEDISQSLYTINMKEFDTEQQLKELEETIISHYDNEADINKQLDILVALRELQGEDLLLIDADLERIETRLINNYNFEVYKSLLYPLSSKLGLKDNSKIYLKELESKLNNKEKELITVNDKKFLDSVLEQNKENINFMKNNSSKNEQPDIFKVISNNVGMVKSKFLEDIKNIKNVRTYIAVEYLQKGKTYNDQETLRQFKEFINEVKKVETDKVKKYYLNIISKQIDKIEE